MIVPEINFGINIVEIVTKGLYTNALDALREYVQNSCDATDDAVRAGILREGDGEIKITIDKDARRITIEDNGIGISAAKDFLRIMSNIGNSDKDLKTDRGFRGIGRLGGVTYCKTLIFKTKVAGEKKISTLTINAEKLREEFFSGNKRSAEQVLSKNMIFDALDADNDEHFFRVELLDIVETNETLLDVVAVRNYLSFVAPVTYSSNFYYQTEIYKHAAELDFKITEYRIEVNGEPLVKPYKINVRTRNGEDEIFGLDFRDFKDAEGNLIAWSWVGLSNFKGVLDQTRGTPDNMMRGIRLRQKNIQIGDESIFQDLFAETRGTNYFIGEVHAVDTKLRPTSRRDDFELDKACKVFREKLREYFDELSNIYNAASDVRSMLKAVNAPAKVQKEFQSGKSKFQTRAELDAELDRLNKTAETAQKKIINMREKAETDSLSPLSRVVVRMTSKEITSPPANQPLQTPEDVENFPPVHWRKDLRKLYNAIKKIIIANPKLAGEKLLDKIKEELAK